MRASVAWSPRAITWASACCARGPSGQLGQTFVGGGLEPSLQVGRALGHRHQKAALAAAHVQHAAVAMKAPGVQHLVDPPEIRVHEVDLHRQQQRHDHADLRAGDPAAAAAEAAGRLRS